MTIISSEKEVENTVIGKESNNIKEKLLEIPEVSKVKKVCMDMCPSFAKAVREVIEGAEIILDRFHIVKMLNKKMLEINSKEYNKLDEKERNRFEYIRYVLTIEYSQLHKDEKRLLKDYLRKVPTVKEGYWKIQEFRKILFNYQGYKRSFVSQKLTEWIEGTRKYFAKILKSFEKWWDELVNACIFKDSNGRQEGINNKIKALKRRGFGYRNWLNFEYRIYAECRA
jgi:transposase